MPKRIDSKGGSRERPPKDHMAGSVDQIVAGMRKLGKQEVKAISDPANMRVGIFLRKSNTIIWIGLWDLRASLRAKNLPEDVLKNIDDFAWATAYTAWETNKSASAETGNDDHPFGAAPLYPHGAMPSRVIDPDASVDDPLKKHAPNKKDRFDLI
jgi:hypothetical protein